MTFGVTATNHLAYPGLRHVMVTLAGERLAESRGNLEHKDLHVSRELTCLVLRMLDSEPAARPTASAINLEISQHQGPPQAADTSMERVASLCHGLPATPAQNQGTLQFPASCVLQATRQVHVSLSEQATYVSR